MIICSKCLEEKDISEFRRDQYNMEGIHPNCNACANKNQRKFYRENLDHVRNYAREYYKKNSAKIAEQRKIRKTAKDKSFEIPITVPKKVTKNINIKYGNDGWKKSKESKWRSRGIIDFTYSDFEKMLISQDNKCYICNKEPSKNASLGIDHNHKTGKPRALLCNNCNNGIGKLGDDIALLQKAINYLKLFDNE